MQSVLIVIHILIVIALVAVVLLQRSEGGVLGIGRRLEQFHDRTRARRTRCRARPPSSATLFFATSILMSIIAGWSRTPHSILTRGPAAPASQQAPQPVNPGNILDQLKQLQGQSNAPAAAPTAPAAPSPRQRLAQKP